VKTKYRLIGLDAKAETSKCDKKFNELSKVTTVADWAQQSGMDTGKNFKDYNIFSINSKRFKTYSYTEQFC